MKTKTLLRAVLTLTTLSSFLAGCNDNQVITTPTPEEAVEPSTFTDAFLTRAERKIDVLWVIDDSGSMGGEQDKLAADFAAFISDFTTLGLDYQIAVVTTDVQDATNHRGRIQGEIMTRDTPDIVQTFSDTALVGTSGSRTTEEQGLEAARLALSPEALATFNAGFLREDAVLAIIFVSDEDDQSTPSDDVGIKCVGTNQDTSACAPVADYVDFFHSLKSRDDLVQISTIVGETPDGCSNEFADADPAFRYAEATALTGGLTESICRETFGPALENLGEVVSTLARNEFPTTFEPVVETLEVTVDGVAVPAGPDTWEWNKEAGAIVFTADLTSEACTDVQIHYQYTDETILPTAPELTLDRTCLAVDLGPMAKPDNAPFSGSLDGGAVAACSTIPGQSSQTPMWVIALLLAVTVVGLRLARLKVIGS